MFTIKTLSYSQDKTSWELYFTKRYKRFVWLFARVVGKWLKCQAGRIKLILKTSMFHLEKFLQRLWKAILASNLHKNDKAEILRMLIFALTIIGIIILNHP
jgi:hypothetical protein